ncbi:unnamed protein product [Ilex paraguariensis]|uniref:Uncharacterized protein n=1 Tax=Ilex paraguariensis TaxID=185542 RepID=A0ABC8R243_9AQUA
MAASKEVPWKWVKFSWTLALAAISASTVYFWRRKWRDVNEKAPELELSLKALLEKCAAKRQGRIRAQQALAKILSFGHLDTSACIVGYRHAFETCMDVTHITISGIM